MRVLVGEVEGRGAGDAQDGGVGEGVGGRRGSNAVVVSEEDLDSVDFGHLRRSKDRGWEVELVPGNPEDDLEDLGRFEGMLVVAAAFARGARVDAAGRRRAAAAEVVAIRDGSFEDDGARDDAEMRMGSKLGQPRLGDLRRIQQHERVEVVERMQRASAGDVDGPDEAIDRPRRRRCDPTHDAPHRTRSRRRPQQGNHKQLQDASFLLPSSEKVTSVQ
mmetsp:Transcript_2095/g.5350  ORF Transcript_2095/g.5350 Transcript_2095/m.5350 type:complete len:218 (+) Transcript_2095:427-1080(+)